MSTSKAKRKLDSKLKLNFNFVHEELLDFQGQHSNARLKHLGRLIAKAFSNMRLRQKHRLNEQVTLVFLQSKEMKKINFHYRGKNKATDVLSFSGESRFGELGELLFCVPVLRRQAKEQKHSFEVELVYLWIHGLLHLLGYDHELSKKEENLMFRIQDEVFDRVKKNLDS
jgi:probable rRNA maturation factor